MSKKVGIYLAGSIKKAHENPNESFWTDADISLLKNSFEIFEPIFLNPAIRNDNLADAESTFGRDMSQVFCSHVVFVDARDRRGLGVGSEMMWAKINNIAVISWSPKNSHYNKSKTTVLGMPVDNFIHPFIFGLSDKIVENLPDGADWIEKMLINPTIKIKGIKDIQNAMEYYQKTQLSKDTPMKEILSNLEIKQRLQRSIF